MKAGVALAVALIATSAAAEERPFPPPPKEWPQTIDDRPILTYVIADRIEYRWNDEASDAVKWDLQCWVGGDWHKLWFKFEGEDPVNGSAEERQGQLLYARLLAPFWHLQAGLRYEDRPAPARSFGVLGVQGLAPYWFNLEAAAFLSEEGDVSARLEVENELLFTQRLILQPRLELNLATDSDEERGVGQGLNDAALGLRLRYEIRREFAPYLGVVWSIKLGETADIARREDDQVRNAAVVAGVRVWF